MAYQSVGTPRFYIDQYQYLKSSGFDFEAWYDEHAFPELFHQFFQDVLSSSPPSPLVLKQEFPAGEPFPGPYRPRYNVFHYFE